ncbi:MAG TPA: patatin-like phospholipase family protein [Longimicrobiaceae bacterium]|nr:patatin-like phospholipase family protein [Longimicrobiaceae bacterium]
MSENAELPLAPPASGSGPRTILVLGGGGMKGIAHIGVWKALEEAGIRPDAVIGTSIGALIGAGIAGGHGWRELAEIARKLTKDDIVSINRRAVFFGGVREEAVFEGDHFRAYLERILPVKHFHEMTLPFRLNTVSLVSGEEVWFGTDCRQDIPVPDAVYASCALPIYFPPLRTPDGDYLVDGGVLDVFPIRKAAAWGAERIIGVDVGSELLPPAEGYFDRGMIAIHDRVLNLNLREQRSRCLDNWDGPPLLYIRPKVWHLGGWDFDRTQYFLEEGYRAAREAIQEQVAA